MDFKCLRPFTVVNSLNLTGNVCGYRGFLTTICGLWWRKQVSQSGISNYLPQFTVGCNYLALPDIPTSGAKVLIRNMMISLHMSIHYHLDLVQYQFLRFN